MHPLSDENKYVGFLLMKMSQEYFSLGREGIRKVTMEHVGDLTKHSDKLTLNGADTLEEIHNAAVDFRMGAKAAYIEVADIVVGIKAPPRRARSNT